MNRTVGKATKAEQVSQIAVGPVSFVVYKYAARGRFWNLNDKVIAEIKRFFASLVLPED